MKRIFTLAAMSTLMLASCVNNQKSDNKVADSINTERSDSTLTTDLNEDNRHNEAYIRQRIDTIYRSLVHYTEEDGIRQSVLLSNPDSLYCSTRYNELLKQAIDICAQTEDILFDADYWICGQDVCDDFHHKIQKVRDITDSTAIVELTVYNDNPNNVVLNLHYERNDWYVDDFNGENLSYLRETIRNGQQSIQR